MKAGIEIGEKKRILDNLGALEEKYGRAPLSNIAVESLIPDDFDVVAVGALPMMADGKCVLVRREETPKEWIIPGGTLDHGEDLVAASERETYEETGLKTLTSGLLRIGLKRSYAPKEFVDVNQRRYGTSAPNLLFINFISRVKGGQMDATRDPSNNILEVRGFDVPPFDEISHVYKVLFVFTKLSPGNLADYPAVQFSADAGA